MVTSSGSACLDWNPQALEEELPKHVLTGSMRYEGFERLGAGGKAEVFRCRDVNLGRDVAYKVLHHTLLSKPIEQQMIVREARLMTSLEHPSVPVVHDLGRDRFGRPYYTMTLAEGPTLFDVLESQREGDAGAETGYDLERIVHVLMQVAEACAAVHDAGVVHGDLKPENLILGEHGVAIVDWGLATINAASGDTGIQAEWGRQGSALYMSPEQARAEARLTPASDIYSLGVVLYECLTLHCPLHGPKSSDTLRMVQEEEPTRPSLAAPERVVPSSLEEVCLRALAKSPDDRFASMQAFKQALEDCHLDLLISFEREEAL